MTHTSPDPDAVREENRRIRWLRWLVNLSVAELSQGDNTLEEAQAIVERTRKAALALFPGKGRVFDLVVRPRLARVILERYGDTGEERVQ